MRKVLLNKYKYTFKDVFRWFGIILMHFFGFYAYIMVLLTFHKINGGEEFFPAITILNWGIFYPMTLAPVLSGVMHIIYAERGYTNIKAILWIHAICVAILVPVVIFAF